MQKVLSKDGTTIAFDVIGRGLPIILVDGALCSRSFGPMPKLAPLLAEHFTVFIYDRRGRGDSTDATPWTVEREVEDIEALLNQAGGSAFVYGTSSGAALALKAANRLPGIRKVVLYEAPFVVDDSYPPIPQDYLSHLKALIASERRGDALKFFMKRVGVPAVFVAAMRLMPSWSKLKAVAHTLVYDISIVEDNQQGKPLMAGQWASVTVPTLVAVGGKSPQWMLQAMKMLADVLPNAKHHIVKGQTHMLKASAIAPVIVEFLTE
jgi:pimeloyl-ACP methyl ester carboxylesterase